MLATGAAGADVEWVNGCCMVIRRQCAVMVGEFDERLGSYEEDVDFCDRARQMNWRCLVAVRAAAHSLGSMAGKTRRRQIMANELLLVELREGWRPALIACTIHVKRELGRGTSFIVRLPALPSR